jgi:hypothetical protein
MFKELFLESKNDGRHISLLINEIKDVERVSETVWKYTGNDPKKMTEKLIKKISKVVKFEDVSHKQNIEGKLFESKDKKHLIHITDGFKGTYLIEYLQGYKPLEI